MTGHAAGDGVDRVVDGDAALAQQVVFMKRSMRPGFAGIENELLFDPRTTLLFGDAKDTMSKLLSAVKAM